jgi:methylaspartate mutase sigma subunit
MVCESVNRSLRDTGVHVVVTGTSSDAHVWNLIFVQLVLEELGLRVVNLGPCVPVELLVDECLRLQPQLVVMSSVNGHGQADGIRAVEALRSQPPLAATPAVIGGKLGIAGEENAVGFKALLDAGFDAAFDDAAGLESFRSFVARIPLEAKA